jgi:Tfp pilus assembly protein PilO
MNKLLLAHKIALVLFLVLLAVQAGLYFGLHRPRRLAVQAAEKELQRLQGRLSGKSWPRDGEKLQQILAEMKKVLQGGGGKPGLQQQSEQLLGQAGRMYDAKILDQYGSRDYFVTSVTRLDYQEEYNRLLLSLREQGINLSAQKLNLAEDSASAYNYQLMLQLWTVDRICSLVTAAGLHILTAESAQAERSSSARGRRSAEVRSDPSACISVLPMQAYFQDEKSSAPYLLELPVSLSLRGELPQLQAFVASLQSEDTFLVLKGFEIRALPPQELLADEAGRIRNGPMHFDLTCAGFFTPQTTLDDE